MTITKVAHPAFSHLLLRSLQISSLSTATKPNLSHHLPQGLVSTNTTQPYNNAYASPQNVVARRLLLRQHGELASTTHRYWIVLPHNAPAHKETNGGLLWHIRPTKSQQRIAEQRPTWRRHTIYAEWCAPSIKFSGRLPPHMIRVNDEATRLLFLDQHHRHAQHKNKLSDVEALSGNTTHIWQENRPLRNGEANDIPYSPLRQSHMPTFPGS